MVLQTVQSNEYHHTKRQWHNDSKDVQDYAIHNYTKTIMDVDRLEFPGFPLVQAGIHLQD